jgi:Uma2 family endonuclease
MGSAQMAPLTVEDYRQLPETGPRYQLIEGDLYMAPAPNRFHQDISRNILVIIAKYLERHPIGTVYHAPFDVYFDEINAHQPDIVYVAKDNEILTDAGAEGCPDFVVEILSPKTAYLDKKPKRRVFARSGVDELWIIDPNSKLINVFFLQKDPDNASATYCEKDTFTSRHFPGLKFKGAKIFKRGGFGSF